MTFGPPAENELRIFSSEPPPNSETFAGGIPSNATQSHADSIILFSPNLQILISLDNTNSDAQSDYQTSVSRGFTFTTSQELSIKQTLGLTFDILTASVEVGFALSFSESWETTETKTMSFTCAPGKKAFVYQGTLMSRVLRFDSGTGNYNWVSARAQALTDVLVTSRVPIGKAPSNPVSIKPSSQVVYVR